MIRPLWLALAVLVFAPLGRAADAPPAHGLGLLVGRASDPAAVEKLRAGLADARPETRAAAVRVINASGVGDLVPSVREALAKESDPIAGAEMVRFLAVLARPELDADALAAAKRLGPDVHLALADGLGRRGVASLVHLPALRALEPREAVMQAFYRLATQGGAIGPAAAPILRESAAPSWRTLLANARATQTHVDVGLLVVALRSESAAMRVATYWHLALEDRTGPVPAALTEPFDAAPEATVGAAADPALSVSYEAARRALERAPRADLLASGPSAPELLAVAAPGFETTVRLYQLATHPERDAMRKAAPDPKAFDRIFKTGREEDVRARADGRSLSRTVAEFPKGFVEDTLAATRCTLEESSLIRGGEVTYGTDGRPRSVPAFQGAKGCDDAARVLVLAALAPLGVPSTSAERIALLVPARTRFLTSIAQGRPDLEPAAPATPSAGGSIREPRKVAHVNPEYPRAARESGTQGAVVLEAWIAATGDIYQVRVVESVERSLDLAAVGAVSGWRYTPTIWAGVAVPVLMIVTVNFKLS